MRLANNYYIGQNAVRDKHLSSTIRPASVRLADNQLDYNSKIVYKNTYSFPRLFSLSYHFDEN